MATASTNPRESGVEPTIRVLVTETSSVQALPMEQYLRGVVPSEIGATAPHEAKCAQAVAARSFAAVAMQGSKHKVQGYDVCSTVHCQVYNIKKSSSASDGAVSDTRGIILTYKGKPMSAFYSSHCGGHTEEISSSWPDRSGESAYRGTACFDAAGTSSLDLTKDEDFIKWLDSSPNAYCNPQTSKVLGWAGSNFRWTREYTVEQISAFAGKRKNIGRVTAIRPHMRGVSGRIADLEFIGENGSVRVGPQLEIRQLFEPMLKSSAFVVETSGAKEGAEKFILRGTGSGHAVGMCQTGAMGMANAGKSFRDILQHYYPKANLEKLY